MSFELLRGGGSRVSLEEGLFPTISAPLGLDRGEAENLTSVEVLLNCDELELRDSFDGPLENAITSDLEELNSTGDDLGDDSVPLYAFSSFIRTGDGERRLDFILASSELDSELAEGGT